MLAVKLVPPLQDEPKLWLAFWFTIYLEKSKPLCTPSLFTSDEVRFIESVEFGPQEVLSGGLALFVGSQVSMRTIELETGEIWDPIAGSVVLPKILYTQSGLVIETLVHKFVPGVHVQREIQYWFWCGAGHSPFSFTLIVIIGSFHHALLGWELLPILGAEGIVLSIWYGQ